MTHLFSIGSLSARTGCAVETIRYYEKIGLLTPATRSSGQQRRYLHRQYTQLIFILHARKIGFSLKEIKKLLDLSQSHSDQSDCHEIDGLVKRQLNKIREKIKYLQMLEQNLTQQLAICDGKCINSCQMIESLGQCGPLCQHPH